MTPRRIPRITPIANPRGPVKRKALIGAIFDSGYRLVAHRIPPKNAKAPTTIPDAAPNRINTLSRAI
jgi:hypothetical protein